MSERIFQEQADGAMTEVLGLIDTLQRLSSDSAALLGEQLRMLQAVGWKLHGTSGLDVIDGARRCLHTLFPWAVAEPDRRGGGDTQESAP